MKKRFLLLTTMLSIALVGCGSNKDINATTETSVPMETEPTTEATVESATESTVESTEQEKITGYEVPVDEPTTDENEKVDLSEINDTDTQVADGEENENDKESTSNGNEESTSNSESNNNLETPAEETPADISSESSGTQSFALNETDIELLKYFGATDSEIANIHSSQELDSLLTRLLEDFDNNITSNSGSGSSSSNNDSSNTGGSSIDNEDPWGDIPAPSLNPDDGSLPGSM